MPLTIANTPLTSRLLLGTGKFQNHQQMLAAIAASKTDLVTLAMKRVDLERPEMDVLSPLAELGVRLLPNTSGARTAKEAITAAQIGRTLTQSNWVKLEVHPNPHHLLPDPIATAKAAQVLVEQGFVVLPYCSADPVLCDELAAMGCATVMPLAAPIGTNKGICMPDMLAYIIESATVPVIVDAGIGSPSDACLAMEMGAEGVLINTAIATAQDPVAMARYFAQAVETGRGAFCAGIAGEQAARATSPLTDFLSL